MLRCSTVKQVYGIATCLKNRSRRVFDLNNLISWHACCVSGVIVRRGSVITWYVDDMQTPFLTYDDPQPWSGPGHEYFAFSNWETDTWFDDVTITPLS